MLPSAEGYPGYNKTPDACQSTGLENRGKFSGKLKARRAFIPSGPFFSIHHLTQGFNIP
jgi:hypothetical protein